MGARFGLMPTTSLFTRARLSGDVNARVPVQRCIAVSLAGCLGLASVLLGCDVGPSASERYEVNYLDELDGESKRQYCEDFIALAGGSGERPCSDGSYFVVQELDECLSATLPHCSIDDFEKCVEAGLDDPCKLFSDPPYACLDFAECLIDQR